MIEGKRKIHDNIHGTVNYELYCQSSEDMSGIRNSSVDTIILDPPFNVGIKYKGVVDQQSINSYVALMESVAKECERVLAPAGTVLVLASDTIFTKGKYLELARLFQKIFTETVSLKLTSRSFVVIKHSDGIELPEQAGDWNVIVQQKARLTPTHFNC